MNATAQASVASIAGPKLDNRRVLAALVDLGIVVAGSLVILFAADALSSDTGEIRGALGAVILGWALYYHFAMESGDGQTVGKKLMNLRVVLADGRPAGMREVAVRTVLRVVDGIGLYIVGLIVMLATGQRRQRLGDLAAGTIIVDASATPYAPPAAAVAPVEETVVEDEPVEDGVVEADEPVQYEVDEPVEVEPVEDAVAPVEDEYVAPVALVAPVEDEPVAALTVVENVEDEVVEDEPAVPLTVVEVDEPVEEDEAEEEQLPEVSTPSLEALAHDVAAARTESDEDEPADEPMTLRSVETVSAIDLVMGGVPEEDSSEQDQAPEGPAAS